MCVTIAILHSINDKIGADFSRQVVNQGPSKYVNSSTWDYERPRNLVVTISGVCLHVIENQGVMFGQM